MELITQSADMITELGFFAPYVYILLRTLTIILPFAPTVILDIPAISAFGVWHTFFYALASSMLGASICFFITRHFREKLLARFLSLQRLHTWEDALSNAKRLSTLIVVRIPTSPIFEYISYALGLTKISFPLFFLSTLLGTIPPLVLFFYAIGHMLSPHTFLLGLFLLSIVLLLIIFSKQILKLVSIRINKNE